MSLLAPRRAIPPPPPRRSVPPEPSPAACIAALRVNVAPPRPPPRKRRDPELERLLARKPPPPPTATPPAPARRLPPKLTRLPTPEPEAEPEPEPHEQLDADYIDHCIKCHDFTFIDEHAAQYPRASVTSIQQLAYDLTRYRGPFFQGQSHSFTKSLAFFSGNLRPSTGESTLRSGLAVCDGYAGLFCELATAAGLHAEKVTGYGKGYGYQALAPGDPVPAESSNHAWNMVYLDGSWVLLDSCWGAGSLTNGTWDNTKFAPVHFSSTPAEFGRRHYPSDPRYQLIPEEEGGPISWAEFITEPAGPLIYGDFDSRQFSRDLLQPALEEIQGGGYVNFQLFKLCEHMSKEQAENWVYFVSLPDDSKTPLLVGSEGAWGASVYIPHGMRGDVSLNTLTSFDHRDAKGVSPQLFQSSIGRKAMAWQGLCKWTLV
ncbi:TGc domain-containing protein [Mycena kentingensis (nom. inval.)]|nr:TGc domain-containing protein [Mycena kentingensis (nom. inval.)]